MNRSLRFALLAAGALAFAGVAMAQTISVPQVGSIGPTDLFQDIPNGQPSAQSQYAPATLIGNYSQTQPGNNPENWLIGGDATTNLFQRATTGSSVTTSITYGGPDRWAYWSGTSTAMTVSRDTTAADLRPGYQAAFKMARTSGQTGVVQMCMIQEVESANSYMYQGATAEVDFEAVTGSTFSAASGNMTVYFISGTSTDEGVSKAAFNLNAGGGGSSQWTGQVNTGVVVSLGGAGTGGRYGAVAPIPSGATELAIALCYTPVGTAGANDYIAFGNIQATRNSALTTVAGTAGAALNVNDRRAKAFSRRSQAVETVLQQRYYYQITESATSAVVRGTCISSTTSISNCFVQFPVTMRTAPTMTYATGFLASAQAASSSGFACSGLTTSATVSGFGPSPTGVLIDCASSAGGPAAGTAGWFWDAGTGSPSGAIKASAEL